MTDSDLHALFCEWAAWVRSKRLYSPSPHPQSILGTLVRPAGQRTGNAMLDPEMARLHAVMMGAPDRDRVLLCAEYLWRPYHQAKVPVKRMAGALGFSRQRWYQLVKAARRRVYAGVDKISLSATCQIDDDSD